jgi:mRNA interferase RelE/StbE
MVYEIVFSHSAEIQLKKLDLAIQDRIIKVLERIKIRPHHFVEKLVGEAGYKLKVGDWRVILDIINKDLLILVIKVGHRRNIYKS